MSHNAGKMVNVGRIKDYTCSPGDDDLLGISKRGEMDAQGGRCHIDLSTDMARRAVLPVTCLGGEFGRGYR